MSVKLRMTEAQHKALYAHLFRGDGLEAVAVLLCGSTTGGIRALTVHKILLVPYERCAVRRPDQVTWDPGVIDGDLEEIWRKKLSIVKVHSHPTGWEQFSSLDDESDRSLGGSWSSMFDKERVHGSAILLPSGRVFGRSLVRGEIGEPFSSVSVVGHQLDFWPSASKEDRAAHRRNLQTFGEGTINQLASMRVAVVGCSGTGSIVVEQLARLGVGDFVLVDPDVVEEKNLNRILNSTNKDAKERTPKVEVLARMIRSLGQEQSVEPLQLNLDTAEAVTAVSSCDVIFGCVDSAEGRNLMNRLSVFYTLPYFDVGVGLVADGRGGVSTISGAVHYFFPGSYPLVERGVYSIETVAAEEKKRVDPEGFEELRKQGYIKGVVEERPAVIGVNSFAASLVVHEFLARISPFRNFEGSACESLRFDFCEIAMFKESYRGESGYLGKFIGRGDCEPLLDRPSLSREA